MIYPYQGQTYPQTSIGYALHHLEFEHMHNRLGALWVKAAPTRNYDAVALLI